MNLNKITQTICLCFVLFTIIPGSMAEENSTNESNATIITGMVTYDPNPVPTDAKFRVGPVVKFRPVNDEINKYQDGIVELFMSNPDVNDVNLHVNAYISVPSGIHIYGQDFAFGGGAGTVAGSYEVPPGTSRVITIVVKSAKEGEFDLHFSGIYYPDENKDMFQQISLTYPLLVTEPSQDPNDPEPSQGVETTETSIIDSESNTNNWLPIILEHKLGISAGILVILIGIGVMLNIGRKPPESRVDIRT